MGSSTELATQYRVGKFGTRLASTELDKYRAESNPSRTTTNHVHNHDNLGSLLGSISAVNDLPRRLVAGLD